ncbi:DUF3139 domain-containing protein [Falsibacillus albus]|nr:DUF3139 domain-containing protein [Falsibacillus albus]
MKKKLLSLLLIVFCILFGGFGILYDGLYGNPFRDYLMKNDTMRYLNDIGYTKNDLLSVRTNYSMKINSDKVKGTLAKVTFKDEPQDTYIYFQQNSNQKIIQACDYLDGHIMKNNYTPERKHMLKNCKSIY